MEIKQIILHITALWLISCVHASPRVAPRNGKQDLPGDTAVISEDSFIDYEPSPAIVSEDRPKFCTNCVCGISNRKMRIVGGNVTEVHEFPWIASFTHRGRFYCAGSLITKKHILTAAHCLEGYVSHAPYLCSHRYRDKDYYVPDTIIDGYLYGDGKCEFQRVNVKDIQIVLGDHNRAIREDTVVRRRIKSAHLHENFEAYTWNNDIAIIELDSPVQFDSIVRPACLPENRGIDYAGAMAVVAGWGRTGERESVSDALRKVNLPILSDEECRMAGYNKKRLTENMFCAGYLDGQRDACQGDSGGPLHVVGTYGHLEIVGIVSWGRGCARPQFPGIFTKLTNYLGWLQDHLDGECVCPPPTSMSSVRH